MKWCAVLHENRNKRNREVELQTLIDGFFFMDSMDANPVSVVLCCKKCLSHADHTGDKTRGERGRRANRLHSTSDKPRCAFSITKLRRSRRASRRAEAKSGSAETGDKKQHEPTDKCRSKGDKTPVACPTCTVSARSAEIGQEHQICFVVRHQISTVCQGPSKDRHFRGHVASSDIAFAEGVQVNQACPDGLCHNHSTRWARRVADVL